MLELVLASASPRRLNLLKALGLKCTVLSQDIDESPLPAEKAKHLVKRLALAKARSALAKLSETDRRLVLGSDTVVVCDDEILGKPQNKADGLAMLRLLSGRTHQVLTAVALMNHDKQAETMSVTDVSFTKLSDAEIEAYWESGEPVGKAGSYAVQGLGAMLVNEIHGSYSGVVGLPIFETVDLLRNFGIDIKAILQNQR
ncbi:Maf family nucleotide pyrophosphatase [Gammaproteobacteria bacterium]|jgi:septum formation protein|nr:Maf family nucleotide pyrophosphatase [Gammaproteobacteria bacterium]